jgi:CDP-4-dehydro-6-deoxyglucose reductase
MAQIPPEQQPKTVTVVWVAVSQDLHFNVADIAGSHTYIPVQSRPSDDWTGAKGYVQEVLLQMKPDLSNAAVFACGSDAMIQQRQNLLGLQAGLPVNRFYSDAFVRSGTN